MNKEIQLSLSSEQMPIDRKFANSGASPTYKISTHTPARRQWGYSFLLITLLALPLPASAQPSWLCRWLPWLCNQTPTSRCGSGLVETNNFGENTEGNLIMCSYVPDNLASSRPLVVALHGCAQQASDYDDETAWIKFADQFRFALLLPQQQTINNNLKCFNWFLASDNVRDKGEPLSIQQMILKMKADHSIDPAKIYITGLSGGAGMTAVMLSAYPELFAGGATIAGIPYKCANNFNESTQCGVSLNPGQVAPMKDLTPTAWGNLVREASNPREEHSPISIWHGSSDTTVNPEDQREMRDQWTNVLGIDQMPNMTDTINGHPRNIYKDITGKVLVETILVNNMGHAAPIDPANGCGKTGQFVHDAKICSTEHIIKFWGLDQP